MSESYELKPINKPIFFNLEQGGTSENESIYHYLFNHGVISYPYSKDFIDYIDASIPNLKFHSKESVT
ncbi:hypothetical protein H5410_036541 [Solanum commersonii]|uniref:Uncharacterized protein n=1 Tax=Solanum commersonii TaxID=4109 RepID=A0A9J5Y544_SOLCO|nr:hypothetical protein H5410_036541 [Solanum commersonii]